MSRWIRTHLWPWTAIGQAYRIGFMHGVHAGARGVSEHIRDLAQKAHLEEVHERSRWN